MLFGSKKYTLSARKVSFCAYCVFSYQNRRTNKFVVDTFFELTLLQIFCSWGPVGYKFMFDIVLRIKGFCAEIGDYS